MLTSRTALACKATLSASARNTSLCARCDFFLRVVYGCMRLIDLGDEFWDLQHRQHLSLVDMVPYVDVDMSDVAGHLGVQLDVLVGNELAGDGKRSGNGLPFHHGATAAYAK